MYHGVLLIHSWVRWIVIIAAIVAVGGAIANLARRAPWRKSNDIASAAFVGAFDLQFLLGATLFAVGTPWFSMFFRAPGAGMKNAMLRYWTIEHGFGMIIALVLAHIGRIVIKRRTDPVAGSKVAAIWLGIALLIILITVPWPFMSYGRPLVRM